VPIGRHDTTLKNLPFAAVVLGTRVLKRFTNKPRETRGDQNGKKTDLFGSSPLGSYNFDGGHFHESKTLFSS